MTCGREIGYTCSDNPSLRDPGCGEHFGSLRAFDRHMVGPERRCLTARQLLAREFHRKPNGTWTDEPVLTATRQTSLRLRQGRPRGAVKKSGAARRRPQGASLVSTTRAAPRGESEATAAGDST